MKKLLIGCVFLCFFFFLGSYTLYRWAQHAFANDPAKNAQLAAEIAPGATAPAGFVPDVSINVGMRSVIYHERDKPRTIFLFEGERGKDQPPAAADYVAALKTFRAKQDAKSHAVVDKETTLEMATHSGPISVLARQVHLPDGKKKTDFLTIAQNPKQISKIVILMADSPLPPEDDGQFFSEYLSHLDIAPWMQP